MLFLSPFSLSGVRLYADENETDESASNCGSPARRKDSNCRILRRPKKHRVKSF